MSFGEVRGIFSSFFLLFPFKKISKSNPQLKRKVKNISMLFFFKSVCSLASKTTLKSTSRGFLTKYGKKKEIDGRAPTNLKSFEDLGGVSSQSQFGKFPQRKNVWRKKELQFRIFSCFFPQKLFPLPNKKLPPLPLLFTPPKKDPPQKKKIPPKKVPFSRFLGGFCLPIFLKKNSFLRAFRIRNL